MQRPRTVGRYAVLTLPWLALVASAAGEPAAPVGAGDLARIEQTLAAREYETSRSGTGLQAPNRAHGLRTWFEPTGIRVHDRTAEGSPELLGLSLTGLGRGAELSPLTPGAVRSDGARVEIRRPSLVEWYVNSEAGLEQGFTLAERPIGEGPLVLELALRGASASPQREGVLFATGAGRRLSYAKLAVTDGTGHPVTAQLTVASPERVRILVEDDGAAYPLVIDPLLTQAADTQLEADQINARLGLSVAAAGDVNGDGYGDVIVGADRYDSGQGEEGAAFIFLGSASGIASAGAGAAATRLEGDLASAGLGFSVAGAGDVNGDGYDDVIVGAPTYGGALAPGAAFVFLGSASGVASAGAGAAATQLGSNQAGSEFGFSVASAGDVNGDGYADVMVGAYSYDTGSGLGASDEGAAFVFLGSASGVSDATALTAHAQIAGNENGARVGVSVSGAGDVNGDGYDDVIAGARYYDSGQSDEGAAFVFLGSSSGIIGGGPGAAATLLQSNQTNSDFGISVAAAGDVNGDGYSDVIVGAKGYSAGTSLEGAAFVFLGSASGIPNGNPTTAAGQLESDQGSALLGQSVGGAGDVNGDGYGDVLAGATLYDGGHNDEGAVFVFLGGPSGVVNGHAAAAFARLESNQADAWLGFDAAGAGDVNGDGYADVIGGAYFYDSGESDEGAAFVYLGGAQGIVDGSPANAAAQLESNQANAELGSSVAGAGDVNGDGYADVIVGAPAYDSGESYEGAAFIFLGGPTGVADGHPASAATRLESNQVDAELGSSVASAGDVNGDGYSDVIVGAWQYDGSGTDTGGAFIFHGSASGIPNGNPATAATRLESDQPGAYIFSAASAGDVNGDGYADVIAGIPSYSSGQSEEGAAFVFLGSASGVADGSPANAAAQLESNQASAYLGWSVAGVGDVNGDGYADVIVGAGQFDAGQLDEGAAFVFLGSAAGVADGDPSTASAQLESDQASANLGAGKTSVAGAGDVNRDGYADVIVGAPFYAAGQGTEGAAFVFHGGPSGIADGSPATAHAQLESDQVDAWVTSVAGIGDVNGDGFGDVIVGSPYYDAGETDEGVAFVFLGSASGISSGNPSTAAATLETDQADSGSLFQLAGVGDLNGDGFADVVVGADAYDGGQGQWEGAAFLFYGGGNQTGRPVLARQLRGNGSQTPVQAWGSAHEGDDFQVRATATHPHGRGRVKLQVQSCPTGVLFGHASCTTSTSPSWTDVTASAGGVTLTHTVSGLAENSLQRWRARILHAPFGVSQAGITAPPNPAHGPWRRLFGQAVEADIRMLNDTDDDDDGLLDAYETDTGVYVSPTNTGTDPNDPDSDDDGLLDGAEVALGTNPNDSDHDDDGDLDGADNCPFIVNASQANGDALSAGDACQCGNVDATGGITAADYQLAREAVVKTPGGSFDPDFCDVNGDAACDVEDLAILQRIVNAQPATVQNACEAYTTP